MATNYLAPPTYNSLLDDVPPLEPPPYVPPRPMRFGQRLENLSIGAGRGVTEQLQSAADFIRNPVQVTRETLQQLAALYDDPRLALEMLREVRRKAASGPLGMGEVIGSFAPLRAPGGRKPTMQELDVYHGTPHRFETEEGAPLGRFRSERIGTGEGAQAYGYGLYFAENPDIAKHYQTQLGKFYDQMQTPEGTMSLEKAVTKYHPDGKTAAKVLSTFRTKTDVDTFNKVINDEILPEIRAEYPQSEWGKFAPQQGALYTVDLPDKMIDRMLDWDRPLSEQRAALDAFRKAGIAQYDSLDSYLRANKIDFDALPHDEKWKVVSRYHDESGLANLKVDIAYKQLAKKLGSDQAASEYLQKAGIPGIRYLDAGSRYGTGGTRNFVVFPGEEQSLRILERK